MHRDSSPPPDDAVEAWPVSSSIHESEIPRDYPWPDPDDDDFDDLAEPNKLDLDDPHWDAFLADDDELDPQPAPGDFWPEGECE